MFIEGRHCHVHVDLPCLCSCTSHRNVLKYTFSNNVYPIKMVRSAHTSQVDFGGQTYLGTAWIAWCEHVFRLRVIPFTCALCPGQRLLVVPGENAAMVLRSRIQLHVTGELQTHTGIHASSEFYLLPSLQIKITWQHVTRRCWTKRNRFAPVVFNLTNHI